MMNRKCMKMIGSKENVNEKCKFMLHDGLWLIYENFAALAAHQFTIMMCVGILMHSVHRTETNQNAVDPSCRINNKSQLGYPFHVGQNNKITTKKNIKPNADNNLPIIARGTQHTITK